MSTKPIFVDFDQLIYLQLDHAPGYAQWWVMLNLGHATAPDGKGNSILLQRFRRREDAEEYKAKIKHGCIVCNEPEHTGWMPIETASRRGDSMLLAGCATQPLDRKEHGYPAGTVKDLCYGPSFQVCVPHPLDAPPRPSPGDSMIAIVSRIHPLRLHRSCYGEPSLHL